MKLNFKGFIAPAFAPFSRKTGELDLSIVLNKTYPQHYIQNGVQGVLVNGTMGEGLCLSVSERKTVLEAWMKAAKNTPLHIMVQVGGIALADVQELARHAESLGVHSLLCLPALYHRPDNVSELSNYLSLVGRAAPNTPLVYYHNAARTGVNYLNLAEFLRTGPDVIPTLAGIKFASTNLEEASRCVRVGGDQLSIMMANDYLIGAGFFEGVESLNATTLNMFGPLITDIYEAMKSSKLGQAKTKQQELNRAIDTITKHGKWIPTMKEAMHIITGLDFGQVREPQGVLTATQVNSLRSDLAALNLAK